MVGEQPLELLAGVLAAAIGVMQQRIRFASTPATRKRLVTTYYDTSSLSLLHNGIALRVRKAGRDHAASGQDRRGQRPIIVRHDAVSRSVQFNDKLIAFAKHWGFVGIPNEQQKDRPKLLPPAVLHDDCLR